MQEPVPSNFGLMLGRELPPWRLIKYVRAAEDGSYNQQANAWTTIQFRGNSVGTLRNELASRTGITDVDFVMCIQAGRQGRLTPVLVNMPREGHGDTVYIVIIVSGTPGETLYMTFPQLPTVLHLQMSVYLSYCCTEIMLWVLFQWSFNLIVLEKQFT